LQVQWAGVLRFI